MSDDERPIPTDPSWIAMQIDVAVTKEKVSNILAEMKRISDDLRNVYATKTELAEIRDDILSIKAALGWIVKIVLGAVVVALISTVLIKGQVPHP